LREKGPVDGREPFPDQMIKHEHQRRDDEERAHARERLHESILEPTPVVIGGGHFPERMKDEG
jgi:hypothetical protein